MPSDWPKYTYSKLMDVSANIVKAVRNKVGVDFDIAIEIHRNMRPHEAIVFAMKLKNINHTLLKILLFLTLSYQCLIYLQK